MRLFAVLALCTFAPASSAQLIADVIDAPVQMGAPVSEVVSKVRHVSAVSTSALPPFTGVALQGHASGDSLRGWIRFSTQNRWSDWFPLYIVRSYTDAAFLAAYRSERIRNADYLEVRLEVGISASASILQAGTFLDEEQAPRPRESPERLQQASFVIYPPALHDRAEWGAEDFRGTPVPLNQPNYHTMTLHHTAGFAAVTLTEGLEQVKRIQDFHQNGRGWSDIGYHYLMDQEGRLYQGRPYYNASVPFEDGPRLVRGAHVGGHNTGNIGVSLMGCYHPPEGAECRQAMTEAARDSLVVVLAYLSERYELDPDVLRGHRDFSSTACPGDNNYGLLPSFRELVADLLITGNAALGTAALSAASDSIGVVVLQWKFLSNTGIESFVIERETAGTTSPVIAREGADDGTWVDVAVSEPGALTYVLTARGRGRRQALSSADVRVRAQDSYILSQSFPNPVSAHATIRFFLRQSGIVTLQLLDISGRRVLSLADAYREKDTWHSVTIDATSLASGTYYYQLHVDGFAGTIYQAARPLVVVH